MLVDTQIRELFLSNDPPIITPFAEGVSGGGVISYGLTSAGYDLRLATDIWVSKTTHGEVVDPKRMREEGYLDRIYDKITVEQGSFVLPAHSYVLGRSYEYLRIPRNLKGTCTGKSTLARVGVLINTTPLEPGWHGYLTIEIGNVSPSPVRMYVLEGIAQLELHRLEREPETDYAKKGGIYQAQTGVTPARVRG